MAEEERLALVAYLAATPDAGELLRGTGAARKLRWRRPGKGKSGGYRVITFFSGPAVPVFLLNVFSKSTKVNLSAAERNELRRVLGGIAQEYREGTRKHAKSR